MSRLPLDLSYTHEMARGATDAMTSSCRSAAARDLTARLRCLKALIDAERDVPQGSCVATPPDYMH